MPGFRPAITETHKEARKSKEAKQSIEPDTDLTQMLEHREFKITVIIKCKPHGNHKGKTYSRNTKGNEKGI